MSQGPLPWREALNWAAQACAGLAAAHQKGIIHRDIKPENLLLARDADGREILKVIDFGIAKVREDAGIKVTGVATSQTGFFMGTPDYASPEQAAGMRGNDLDERTDLYSLGLVLFEMLTGRKPFEADTVVAALLSRLQQEHVDPSTIRPDLHIPRPVSDLVVKATAREKEHRFNSADEMRQAIVALLGGEEPSAPFVKPRRWALAVYAALACVAAIGAGWFFWPRSPAPAEPVKIEMNMAAPSLPLTTAPVVRKTVEPDKPKAKQAEHKAAAVALPVPAPNLATGETKVNPADALKYVWIGPGKFSMGCSPSDNECNADESPAHEVTLSKGFWIGETEVTQAAYERVSGRNPSENKGPDLPVDSVSWYQANAFCKSAGMRLPAETEWEYAARAGGTGPRYGRPIEIAWLGFNSEKKTHPVAQKKQNAYGLYDMLGNVAEWTADADGELYIVRGGSFMGGPKAIRLSERAKRRPGARAPNIGFRCAGDN
jgi:serine/threonine-protein kinase